MTGILEAVNTFLFVTELITSLAFVLCFFLRMWKNENSEPKANIDYLSASLRWLCAVITHNSCNRNIVFLYWWTLSKIWTHYVQYCSLSDPPSISLYSASKEPDFSIFYVILSNSPLTILKAFKMSPSSFCIHCQESIFKEIKGQ